MPERRPRRIALASTPTRIARYGELGDELGIDLWIKHENEADGLGSGHKARKLEYLLPFAVDNGFQRLILAGSAQSNCAMALSAYAPPLGLGVDLVLPGPPSLFANQLDMVRCGARIEYIPHWDNALVESTIQKIVAGNDARGMRSYVVPTGATTAETVFAALDLAAEIADQQTGLSTSFDSVVCAVGTGGTYAGLVADRMLADRDWKLIGITIANDGRFFVDVVSRLHGELRDSYGLDLHLSQTDLCLDEGSLGGGYGVSTPADRERIAEIRRRSGLVLDTTYTFKAFDALRRLVSAGAIAAGSSVLFIHTGGTNERFIR